MIFTCTICFHSFGSCESVGFTRQSTEPYCSSAFSIADLICSRSVTFILTQVVFGDCNASRRSRRQARRSSGWVAAENARAAAAPFLKLAPVTTTTEFFEIFLIVFRSWNKDQNNLLVRRICKQSMRRNVGGDAACNLVVYMMTMHHF